MLIVSRIGTQPTGERVKNSGAGIREQSKLNEKTLLIGKIWYQGASERQRNRIQGEEQLDEELIFFHW